MKQVVILAGGKGTRLRERLGDLPKPLVDICGTPLLERQILLAKMHGFTDVLILVNYAAESIVNFCASKNNWGLNIQCIDDGVPRGTAGATLAVFEYLAEEFLVMYGDTMLEVDLQRFHAFHTEAPDSAATLFLHPNDHPHDSDLVDIDENGQVIGFFPYPHDASRYYPNLVNAALYWVKRSALVPWIGVRGMFDFGKDLFPAMLAEGLCLRGYNSPEYIKDCGTPARLDKVCMDFTSGKIERAGLNKQQAAVFLDRDGTINREIGHLAHANQLELLPGVEAAIKRLNASEYRCCVVTNQPVIARGDCSIEELRQIHNKMETLLGRMGAFIDRIYYCPHHPDKGFEGEVQELKIECDCRKPKTGMLDQAVSELNISRPRSWLIGDTSIDMLVAHRAGIKSILVETGFAGLDQRVWAIPDFIVPDLPAAVSFIVDKYPKLLARCLDYASEINKGDVVFIGGQSRSGKSTFSSVLRDALLAQGKSSHVISVDRWLRSASDREPGVLGRYDLTQLRELLSLLYSRGAKPSAIKLPAYSKLQRQHVENVEILQLSVGDVIIVEGTVALALADQADIKHRFYVDIEESERRRRVLAEYRLRGYSEDDALTVYTERLEDEVPIVKRFADSANQVTLF